MGRRTVPRPARLPDRQPAKASLKTKRAPSFLSRERRGVSCYLSIPCAAKKPVPLAGADILRPPLPPLPLTRMDVVVNAMLSIKGMKQGGNVVVYAHAATGNWHPSTLTWNNQPGHKTRVLDYQKVTATTNTAYEWDVTGAAKQWYNKELSNYGIALIGANEESTEASYAQFVVPDATLVITYRRPAGLESWWSARELSVDRAGTAYVGDWNGQVTLVKTDVAMAGTVCPVTVSHVYNTVYAGGQYYETGPGPRCMPARRWATAGSWTSSRRSCGSATTTSTFT